MTEFRILGDLVVVFLVAIVVVALLRRVGVPPIAGFIVAGTIVGPPGLSVIADRHDVELLAEIGVALLLFGIGIELHVTRLRRLWRPVIIGGALQVGLSIACAAGLAMAMGRDVRSATLLGFLVAVSSTAIVLRGLEARGEVDAPHGRLTLGILIFQDLSVVPMMLALPLLAGSGGGSAEELVPAMAKALAVLGGIVVAAWFVVPRLLHAVALTRQRDLFVLAVFLVCIGTAWVVSLAGVSLALGAFLAGLVVAGSEYRHQAMADLIPFREVLTSLFFVSIGMLLEPRVLWIDPGPVAGLLGAILFGKFAIVFLTAAIMRLPIRVCVLAGASLAQVGEFSFVLLQAVPQPGPLEPWLSDRLLAAVILSMLVTPVAIALGPSLAAGAARIRPLTRLLGVRSAVAAAEVERPLVDHVIIAGFGIAGRELAGALREAAIPYVIVDLNPSTVQSAGTAGEPIYFGDITSAEVLGHLGAARAREIVLVVNDPSAAERAVVAARRAAPRVPILVRARYAADVPPLLAAGATEVVPAEIEAAVEVTSRVLRNHGVERERRARRLQEIRARNEIQRGR